MQEGIEKCKNNITDYLKDASLIAQAGRYYHAIISLEFALEEFGKILLLKETMNNCKGDSININSNEFCSHDRKVERALKILDPSHKYRILFESFAERGLFEAGMLEGETVIGDSTRLDCAFVDFIDNAWTVGRNIKPAFLQDLADVIEKGLKTI
jgi:AbiV family abortive infection protein